MVKDPYFDDELFFARITCVWVFFAIGLSTLALVGFFHILPISLLLFGACAYSIHTYKKFLPHKTLRAVILTIAILLALFALFVQPTIFSGRDHGTLSQAAITLSQHHTLSFATPTSNAFFALYGPGDALNFPGFSYTNDGALQAHFPIPYIAWLGGFYTLFGVNGFVIANMVLFFFFAVSFFLLTRMFTTKHFALAALALTGVTIPFLLFVKFTLSENLALALLWSGLFALMLCKKSTSDKRRAHYTHRARKTFFAATFLCFALLFFARIEGVIFFFLAMGALLYDKHARDFLRTKLSRGALISVIIFALYAATIIITSQAFYIKITKALLKDAPSDAFGMSNNFTILSNLSTLNAYDITVFLFCGIAGIAWLFYKKHYTALLPLLIVMPTFFYLINPMISPDHPWMLRRYIFALIPALLFYTIIVFYLWTQSRNKNLRESSVLIPLCITAIFLFMLNNAAPFYTYSENRGMPKQVARIAQSFDSRDLVLIDGDASGSGWAMIDAPLRTLHNKNAVYFFNVNDLAKIDRSAFDRTFLVAPRDKQEFYKESVIGKNLFYHKKYIIITNRFSSETTTPPIRRAQQENIIVRGIIYEIR